MVLHAKFQSLHKALRRFLLPGRNLRKTNKMVLSKTTQFVFRNPKMDLVSKNTQPLTKPWSLISSSLLQNILWEFLPAQRLEVEISVKVKQGSLIQVSVENNLVTGLYEVKKHIYVLSIWYIVCRVMKLSVFWFRSIVD